MQWIINKQLECNNNNNNSKKKKYLTFSKWMLILIQGDFLAKSFLSNELG